jgi:hypothetical protein
MLLILDFISFHSRVTKIAILDWMNPFDIEIFLIGKKIVR